jgi:Fe-S-cluster containining protein
MTDRDSQTAASSPGLKAVQHETAQEIERQVERGSMFTHTAIGRNALRLGEAETFLYGLIDVLMAKGLIDSRELQAATEQVRNQLAHDGDVPNAGVSLRIDALEETQHPAKKVNCAERMHICKAICCKLDFALTAEEVEAGDVKWDLGRPYCIRHCPQGFCVHNDRGTGNCSAYDHRPMICRTYSFAKDIRIWKNFENMELNEKWLAENFSTGSHPILMSAMMQTVEAAVTDES